MDANVDLYATKQVSITSLEKISMNGEVEIEGTLKLNGKSFQPNMETPIGPVWKPE